MKTTSILFLAATILCCLASAAFGQRVLDTTEVQDMLRQLTSEPRATWIPSGTIQATHYEESGPKTTDAAVVKAEIDQAIADCMKAISVNPLPGTLAEDPQKLALDAAEFNVRYDLENKYTMTSVETVRYDGERFHWEVVVTDRSDSVALDAALDGNYMADHYSLHKDLNEHRIFAWNGQEYTIYSVSGGQATVDASGAVPHPVNGPLTAGLIPWGNGKFSAKSLAEATVSAEENTLDQTASVHMTIAHSDGSTTEVVLDPSKNYAVTSATLTAEGIVVTYTCSGYQPVSGRWVPTTVVIERKVDSINREVPTLELWSDIKVTSTSAPSLSSLDASLALDTMVEYASPVTASPVMYINSYETDTKELLAKRLACAAAKGRQPQNCATVALQYVASEFGRTVSPAVLADLVGTNGRTSLRDLKRSAQGLGLCASVVTTDLATLKTLEATKAILHLPGQNHFVVLDRVDDRFVWLIDLSDKKFYYRVNAHLFPLDWSAGAALLVSDRSLSRGLPELSDAAAEEIAGGYYACNTLYQEFHYTSCDTVYLEYCEGKLTYYLERWVCGSADSGTCPTSSMVRYQESPCVLDPVVYCEITGCWTNYYMRACE